MTHILPGTQSHCQSDPLAITNRARALLGQNDPLALELFYMGRRHALAVQEARAQIAMYAFTEGLEPHYEGPPSNEWRTLANASHIWSDPILNLPVAPGTTRAALSPRQGHPLDGQWVRDHALQAWRHAWADAEEVAA